MRFPAFTREGAALTLALAALAATPAVAQAPEDLPAVTVDVDAKVTPNRAGTKAHPQPVKISVDAKLDTELPEDRPITTGGTVLFPKGGKWNGAKFPKCAENTMVRSGLRNCPPGSIIGKGSAQGWADTVVTRPKITVVNGGANRVYFFTVLNNPARVALPVVGKIKKRTGKWSYQLDFAVPKALQVVAGVPISITALHVEAGKGDILVTTSCPKGNRWPYEATLNFDDGRQPAVTGSTPCKPARKAR